MITRELIALFLQNACTEEEKALVIQHFEAHPEDLETYLPAEEWINFKSTDSIPEAAADRITKAVLKQNGRITGMHIFRWVAAAVVVAGIAGTSFFFVGRSNKANDMMASGIRPSAEEEYILSSNTTNSILLVALADGSTVELSPHSAIRYKKAFNTGQRLVVLAGKALFKVAKDKAKPFVVQSDNITTTALGTSFTINCIKSENTISVALHTGKVKVNTAMPQRDKGISACYLSPGEEFLYNKAGMTATVTRMKSTPGIGHATAATAGGSAKQPDWYMFNSMSLSQVFDQLSDYYNVEIYYVPVELKNRYFTGRLNKNDSLNKIINDIALLNQLSVRNQSGKYIIKKIH